MANASTEKLKALGLRHGEKAVVGLAAMLCVLFLVQAFTKKSIEMTPEDVKSAADAARQNIDKPQKNEDILTLLETSGIKNPGFEKMVEEQVKNAPKAIAYAPTQLWVSPEPGAGLIRDMPELIAPSELYAYPGRGGALIFALDENTGNRLPAEKEAAPDEATLARRKKRRSRRAAGGGSSSSMAMAMSRPGMPGMGGPLSKKDEEKAKKERAIAEHRLKGALVGEADAKDAVPSAETPQEGPFKEITKGLRWVAITGTLDHKKLRENYLTALKNPAVAHPHFKQLDVQRQTKQPDGSWPGADEWEKVDRDSNNKILDNLPEEEEELTPDTVRIKNLVDPLPFLKAGYWERVHVASLVPKEKRELAPLPTAGGMGAPGMSMGSSSSGFDSGAMQQQMQQMQQMQAMAREGSSSMMMPGMDGGSVGATEDTNFAKSEVDELMIRTLDFTVEPDQTYRFRLRIVVYNPNRDREDVAPGVDNKSLELFGPWSEPTEEVTMPPDVAAYTVSKAPGRRSDQVTFQVTRWRPDDGVTVVKRFDAAPGEIVGEYSSAQVPVSDGSGKKNSRIDFNSREIVVDASGGNVPLPPIGAGNAPISMPATSLLVRPDGAVVLRNQADDLYDEVRKDTDANYKRELEESDKARENSTGGGYESMMGGRR
jgi:hypothetical protein